MKTLIFLLAVIIAVGMGTGANAEITFWVDENGVKHWSNEPAPDTGGAESEHQMESKHHEYVPTPAERKEIERERAFWEEIEREHQEKNRQRMEAQRELIRQWDAQEKVWREERIIRALEDIANQQQVPQRYILKPDWNSSYDNQWILKPE